jgi:hypothetical protein
MRRCACSSARKQFSSAPAFSNPKAREIRAGYRQGHDSFRQSEDRPRSLKGLGTAMPGIEIGTIETTMRMANRGLVNDQAIIGVLALQGAVEPHRKHIEAQAANSAPSKRPSSSKRWMPSSCPAAKSTTMLKLIEAFDLWGRTRSAIL